MEKSAARARRAILAGASAAKKLAASCEASGKGSSLKLEVVRGLAEDINLHLRGLAEMDASFDLLAEAAQKCADLATLATCNVEELAAPEDAAETVRLASDATETLSRMVEETSSNDLARRDARSASWKASLAVRQMEELMKSG